MSEASLGIRITVEPMRADAVQEGDWIWHGVEGDWCLVDKVEKPPTRLRVCLTDAMGREWQESPSQIVLRRTDLGGQKDG